jgi:hypothetical protein
VPYPTKTATPTVVVPPPPPPPATPTATATPKACKPGWGYGDDNHEHGGPPGQTGADVTRGTVPCLDGSDEFVDQQLERAEAKLAAAEARLDARLEKLFGRFGV